MGVLIGIWPNALQIISKLPDHPHIQVPCDVRWLADSFNCLFPLLFSSDRGISMIKV